MSSLKLFSYAEIFPNSTAEIGFGFFIFVFDSEKQFFLLIPFRTFNKKILLKCNRMDRCEGVESDCMWAYKIHEKTNKEDFFFEEEIDRKVHSYVDITYECS